MILVVLDQSVARKALDSTSPKLFTVSLDDLRVAYDLHHGPMFKYQDSKFLLLIIGPYMYRITGTGSAASATNANSELPQP